MRAVTEFVVFPGSGGVGLLIERPDIRLGGEWIETQEPDEDENEDDEDEDEDEDQ